VSPQRRIPHVVAIGFVVIYLFHLAICSTALVAWTGEADFSCSDKVGGHFCLVQQLYNLNFVPLNWAGGVIGIFITMYPSLSIANFPLQVITVRNTLSLLLDLQPTGAGESILARKNVCLLLAVLLPPFAVAMITRDVQGIIKVVGCYAGLTLSFLVPLVLVRVGREKLAEVWGGHVQSARRPLKSPFGTSFGYSLVLCFYVGALALFTRQFLAQSFI